MRYPGGIWQIEGLLTGHAQHAQAPTGCTVVLCPEGAVAAVDVRGAAPGTRETDVMRPGNLVDRVHAVLLSGGSAFGLRAADGVMDYLEGEGIGFYTPNAKVPIVTGAVIYDISTQYPGIRPDAGMGKQACRAANDQPFVQGRVGVGSGATVGKLLGSGQPGGIGSASIELPGGVVVAALIVVNALGDVIESDGRIIRGARSENGFLNTQALLLSPEFAAANALQGDRARTNTTIGVIATNAAMDMGGAYRLAVAGHDGLARSISPVHTLADGDALFTMATGKVQTAVSPLSLAAAAAEAARRAVINAVTADEDDVR